MSHRLDSSKYSPLIVLMTALHMVGSILTSFIRYSPGITGVTSGLLRKHEAHSGHYLNQKIQISIAQTIFFFLMFSFNSGLVLALPLLWRPSLEPV